MADSRVSLGIPNIFNGVSQQAPNLRLTSQGEEQVNLYSSLVRGLVKRPPTSHIGTLRATPCDDAFVHFIDRDDSERYTVLINDREIEAFSVADGAEIPVYSPDGLTYLASTTPREEFRAVSLADHTIIVNNGITVAMDTTETQVAEPVGTAYVWVKRGNYGCAYVITINGTSYTYTTPDPTTTSPTYVRTDSIATSLISALGYIYGFTFTRIGSLIKIVRSSNNPFTFGVSDSYASEALVGLKVNVSSRDDLPDVGAEGMWFRMTGTSKDADDDYYVRYNSNSGAYKGIWEEYRGWGIYNKLNATTMPHKLVRYYVLGSESGALGTWITAQSLGVGDIYFVFQQCTWDDRLVGDDVTAAAPAFVGKTISDVFFFNSRLGFLSDEWIIMSRIEGFFNFWPKTVQQVLDDGPIVVSTGQITGLHAALPWNKALLAFSARNQFQITSQNSLTPEGTKADQTTAFDSSTKAHPVASGPNVYFMTESAPFTAVREYFVSEDTVANDAASITGHVPEYIPEGVFMASASSNEDCLMLISTEQRDTIYVYKYYWSGNEKLQSSWSKFTFGTDATILGCDFFGPNVYLVVDRGNKVYLERFPLQTYAPDTGMVYLAHLDRKCSLTGVYESGTDLTTFTLPYDEDTDTALTVVLGPSFTGKIGSVLRSGLRPTAATLTLNGDVTAGAVWIGRDYEARYTLSPFYVRAQDQSQSALLTGRFIVQEVFLNYTQSGDFRFELEVVGRDDHSIIKTGQLGKDSYKVGSVFIDNGTAHCGIQSSNDVMTLHLVNDSPFPSQWQSVEIVGTYDALQRRM